MITRSKLLGLFNEFFSSEHFLVVGASSDPSKYGNKVLKWYLNNNYQVTAVNPNEKIVEGLKTIPNLSSFSSNIPPSKISVSIITPPKVTKTILEEAAKLGITKIWLQPGAENLECQTFAINNNIKLISGGPCVLVDGPKI